MYDCLCTYHIAVLIMLSPCLKLVIYSNWGTLINPLTYDAFSILFDNQFSSVLKQQELMQCISVNPSVMQSYWLLISLPVILKWLPKPYILTSYFSMQVLKVAVLVCNSGITALLLVAITTLTISAGRYDDIILNRRYDSLSSM